MKRNINNSRITKELIFSKISQVSIFAAYTNVDEEVIQDCIDNAKLIRSPFREDIHPSFGFRYDNRGKLKGRDFAGYWWGDCIDAAATVISGIINRTLDVSKKSDFNFVLTHIAKTFSDVLYGKAKDYYFDNSIIVGLANTRQKKSIIEIVSRPWNQKDAEYWHQFNIGLNFLNTHFVYAVDQYYIDRSINPIPKYFYSKNPNDVCYAYLLGQDKKGILNFKLYFPNRDKGKQIKFITNCNTLEGIINMDLYDYDCVIITKSSKDRLAIENYISNILDSSLLRARYNGLVDIDKISVINIPHETYKLSQNEYNWIRERCPKGKIISLMDNDITGIKEAIYLRNNFDIYPIVIPRSYEVKDFSELISTYPIELVNEYFKETINLIYSDGEENKLTWDKEEGDALPY